MRAPSCENIGLTFPIMATFETSDREQLSLLTCSAEDSPARTSATQAGAPASTASAADYGPSTPELLASYDPATSSWKTSQLCLGGDLAEFSETWPRSGLMRNGIAYRLPPLVPLTAATESGSWPTPVSNGSVARITMGAALKEAARKGENNSLATRVAARMWPTPDAMVANDGEDLDNWMARRARVKAQKKNGNGFGMPLAIAARMWPTPTSRDWKDGSAQACTNVPINGLLGRAVHMDGMNANGSLNPAWVEFLMGFETGWTALDASETPSSRRSRKSSGVQS